MLSPRATILSPGFSFTWPWAGQSNISAKMARATKYFRSMENLSEGLRLSINHKPGWTPRKFLKTCHEFHELDELFSSNSYYYAKNPLQPDKIFLRPPGSARILRARVGHSRHAGSVRSQGRPLRSPRLCGEIRFGCGYAALCSSVVSFRDRYYSSGISSEIVR